MKQKMLNLIEILKQLNFLESIQTCRLIAKSLQMRMVLYFTNNYQKVDSLLFIPHFFLTFSVSIFISSPLNR